MKKNAFTLAEMLVVLGILSILGMIVLTIFTRSLRGTNKTLITLSIKENGQSVLETIDKAIRDADDLVCVSNNPRDTIVIFKQGVYTRYRIVLPKVVLPDTSPFCGKNGCIVFDKPALGENEKVQDFINKLGENRICSSTDPLVASVVLTDTDENKGIKVKGGSFTLNKQEGFSDFLTIKFEFEPPPGAPTAIAGAIDPVTFETTVQLR